jgi:hypothetical protein
MPRNKGNPYAPYYNAAMADRLFTLEEARALLPTVRQLLAEIQAAKGEVDTKGADLGRLMALTGGNGHLEGDLARARDAVEYAAGDLQDRIAELEDIGVELKGIDEGLCDFPSLREDRVVYLCFRLGEDDIDYWHELDTGFGGRQPL